MKQSCIQSRIEIKDIIERSSYTMPTCQGNKNYNNNNIDWVSHQQNIVHTADYKERPRLHAISPPNAEPPYLASSVDSQTLGSCEGRSNLNLPISAPSTSRIEWSAERTATRYVKYASITVGIPTPSPTPIPTPRAMRSDDELEVGVDGGTGDVTTDEVWVGDAVWKGVVIMKLQR